MRQEMANVEGASVQRNMDMIAVTFKSDILFPYDSFVLKPGSNDEMARVSKVLNQYPQTNIIVAGHTDNKGTEEYNQKLSERRAESVKNALIEMGVNPSRINTIGYGKNKPIADNSSETGRQMNRRVEIVINPQSKSVS